jgi:hypothetical protein
MPRKAKCISCFIAIAVALVLVTLRARDSHAQPYCVPNAIGVPGNPGPPAWWTSPQPLDDPRWQGALGNSTGLGDQAEVRALTYNDGSKDYVVLSFQVKADPGAAGAGDIVYVGLSDGAAAGVSNVIRLTRGGASSTPAEGSPPPATDLVMRYRNAGNWADVAAVPAWLTADTRINQICSGFPAVCDTWAYRIRIRHGREPRQWRQHPHRRLQGLVRDQSRQPRRFQQSLHHAPQVAAHRAQRRRLSGELSRSDRRRLERRQAGHGWIVFGRYLRRGLPDRSHEHRHVERARDLGHQSEHVSCSPRQWHDHLAR